MDVSVKDNQFKVLSKELPLYYNPFMPQLLFDATLVNMSLSTSGNAAYSSKTKWARNDTSMARAMIGGNFHTKRYKSFIVFAGITNPPLNDTLKIFSDMETDRPGFYGGSLIFYKVYSALANLLPYPETTKLEEVDTRHLLLPPAANYDFVAQYIYNRQLLQLKAYKAKVPYVTLQSFTRSHTCVRFTERGVPRRFEVGTVVNSRTRNARLAAGLEDAHPNKAGFHDFGSNAPSSWMPRLYVGTKHRSIDVYELFYGVKPPELAHADANPANDNVLNLVHADGSPLPPMKPGAATMLKALSERAETYLAPDWLRIPQELVEYRSYRLHGEDRLSIHPDVLDEEYERLTSSI